MNSEQIYEQLEGNKDSLGLIYAIGIIQLRGGFRISEVLKMRGNQIINDTDLYILSDKKSRSKRVHVPELREYLVKWKKYNLEPFKHISRFQVYRIYKKLGIQSTNQGKYNKSVTHAMRKSYVQESYESTGNINTTADIVGHKNPKSTEHYVSK